MPGPAPGAGERIARAVAAGLSPGSSVVLGAGPTAEAVARHLVHRAPLTVAVTSLASALALTDVPGITLLVLGGQAQPGGPALVGPLAVAALTGLDIDVFVLAPAAAHPDSGWSAHTLEEAELARAVMARARATVVAAPSPVLRARSLARIAPLGAASALVTDGGVHRGRAYDAPTNEADPGEQVLRSLAAAAVSVTVV